MKIISRFSHPFRGLTLYHCREMPFTVIDNRSIKNQRTMGKQKKPRKKDKQSSFLLPFRYKSITNNDTKIEKGNGKGV